MSENAHKPASPCGADALLGSESPRGDWVHGEIGLTKRELIAAMAMQGMELSNGRDLSRIDVEHRRREEWAKQAAQMAAIYADALLAELERAA